MKETDLVHCTICGSVVSYYVKRACGCKPGTFTPTKRKGETNVQITRNDPDPDDCDDLWDAVMGRRTTDTD